MDPLGHGLKMAEILTYVATARSENGKIRAPQTLELRLYRTQGLTNLRQAIDEVIRWRADVVLQAEVWELGNHSSRRTFINQQVQKALDAGIFWINSAGNFGGLSIETSAPQAGYARFPGGVGSQSELFPIFCDRESGCDISLTLWWDALTDENGFMGDVLDLDLELFVTEPIGQGQRPMSPTGAGSWQAGQLLGESKLRQIRSANEAPPGQSRFPRENIRARLPRGVFLARVSFVSYQQMTSSRPQETLKLRLQAQGEGLRFAAVSEDSILHPADLRGVLTVGAIDTPRSSTSAILNKPEVVAPSLISLQDGTLVQGSSNSAALVAGLVARRMFLEPNFNRREAIRNSLPWDWTATTNTPAGTPGSVNLGCYPFVEQTSARFEQAHQVALAFGGRVVQVGGAAGVAILTPFRPQDLLGSNLQDPIQRVFLRNNEWRIENYSLKPTPLGWTEVFQLPLGTRLCSAPPRGHQRGLLYMP
jgi:hypothetical protein